MTHILIYNYLPINYLLFTINLTLVYYNLFYAKQQKKNVSRRYRRAVERLEMAG